MKSFFTLIVFFAICLTSHGSHIIGGDFTVQHVSGNTYRAVLVIYRDCNSDTDFDPTVPITVFDAVTHDALIDLEFGMTGVVTEIPVLGNDCFTPSICLETGTYTTEFTLDDNPNGYYLTNERCCRNGTSINMEDELVGFVFTVDVPDPALENSSPVFNPFPQEAYLCINSNNVIDFGATDPDGDELVFSFTDPLIGASSFGDPSPGTATSKPYNIADWVVGYDVDNQVGGLDAMTIDPTTGIIEGQPSVQGYFTLAVKVEEYRGGVKIGEIRREIQLQSEICDEDLASTITVPDNQLAYNVLANTELCFDVTATDPNDGDILFLSAEGELFDGSISPMASFATVNGESSVGQTFCWSPLCHNVRDEPYEVTFRAFSEGCAPEILETVLTVQITVYLEPDEPTEIVGPGPNGEEVYIDLYDASTHCFDFVFQDPNASDSLFVETVSDILSFDNVTMEQNTEDQGSIAIGFCWEAVCADVQSEPYTIDFQVIALNCEVLDTTFFSIPIIVMVQPNEPTTFVQPTQEVFWQFYDESTFCDPVLVTDQNYFDTLQVTVAMDSELFQLPNAAVFDTLNGTSAVSGELCWTPTCEDVRDEPYHVIFTATSNSCKTSDELQYPIDIYLSLPPENAAEFQFPSDGEMIEYNIGDPAIHIPVLASDIDPYDTLSLRIDSPAMTSEGYPATFESNGSVSGVSGNFNWFPGCLDISPDYYPVTFILTSRSCQKVNEISITHEILVTTPSLGDIAPIPNVITPNGDGMNDGWEIDTKDDPCLLDFHTSVFDRWGKEVFISEDPSFYWDGNYGNDSSAEPGVYFQTIEFRYVKDIIKHSGTIQILK